MSGIMRADASAGPWIGPLLVIVALVGRHDFHLEGIPFDQGDHVPETERAPPVLAVILCALAPEKRRNQVLAPTTIISPVTGSQLQGRLPHHALDSAAGKIGQAVWTEKGEAVFQWMLIAQARAEGGNRDGIHQKHRVAAACRHSPLPRHKGLHVLFIPFAQACHRFPRIPWNCGFLAPVAVPYGQVVTKAHSGRGSAEILPQVIGNGGDRHITPSRCARRPAGATISARRRPRR